MKKKLQITTKKPSKPLFSKIFGYFQLKNPIFSLTYPKGSRWKDKPTGGHLQPRCDFCHNKITLTTCCYPFAFSSILGIAPVQLRVLEGLFVYSFLFLLYPGHQAAILLLCTHTHTHTHHIHVWPLVSNLTRIKPLFTLVVLISSLWILIKVILDIKAPLPPLF